MLTRERTAGSALFYGLSGPEIDIVDRFVLWQEFPGHLTLHFPWDRDRKLCFLSSGAVVESQYSDDEKNSLARRVRPGEMFGADLTFGLKPAKLEALVLENSWIGTMEMGDLARALSRFGQIRQNLITMLDTAIRQTRSGNPGCLESGPWCP